MSDITALHKCDKERKFSQYMYFFLPINAFKTKIKTNFQKQKKKKLLLPTKIFVDMNT